MHVLSVINLAQLYTPANELLKTSNVPVVACLLFLYLKYAGITGRYRPGNLCVFGQVFNFF